MKSILFVKSVRLIITNKLKICTIYFIKLYATNVFWLIVQSFFILFFSKFLSECEKHNRHAFGWNAKFIKLTVWQLFSYCNVKYFNNFENSQR